MTAPTVTHCVRLRRPSSEKWRGEPRSLPASEGDDGPSAINPVVDGPKAGGCGEAFGGRLAGPSPLVERSRLVGRRGDNPPGRRHPARPQHPFHPEGAWSELAPRLRRLAIESVLPTWAGAMRGFATARDAAPAKQKRKKSSAIGRPLFVHVGAGHFEWRCAASSSDARCCGAHHPSSMSERPIARRLRTGRPPRSAFWRGFREHRSGAYKST